MTVSYLLILHFTSDFFTQWDKTGFFYQKFSSILSHTFSYTLYIFIGTLIIFDFDQEFSLYFSLYNGISHFIVDVTINYLGNIRKKKKYWNYALIGLNQLINLLILTQTYYYFNIK